MSATTEPKFIEDVDLFLRWCFYYAATEEWDRRHPHRMERGEAIPRPDVRGASLRYARMWLQQLRLKISDPAQRAERDAASRLTYKGQREILDVRWGERWERLPSRERPERQPHPRRLL